MATSFPPTRRLFDSAAVILLSTWALTAQVKSGDEHSRARANLTETVLTTAVVDVSLFGRLYSYSGDGPVYAEPVYVPDVRIGGALHNVLYVVTGSGKLYAFDADGASMPLWIADLTTQPSAFSRWSPHMAAYRHAPPRHRGNRPSMALLSTSGLKTMC